jgi:Flp pilus assembly protein TadD
MKDFDGAIKDLDAAARIDPGYARTYTLRGEVKLLKGDVVGACDDLLKAQKLGYMVAMATFNDYCDH